MTLKERVQSSLGVMGYILVFLVSTILLYCPLWFLDNPWWLDMVIIAVMIFIPIVGDIAQLGIWIWALPVVLQGPTDVFSITFYLAFAIYIVTTLIPASICIFSFILARAREHKFKKIETSDIRFEGLNQFENKTSNKLLYILCGAMVLLLGFNAIQAMEINHLKNHAEIMQRSIDANYDIRKALTNRVQELEKDSILIKTYDKRIDENLLDFYRLAKYFYSESYENAKKRGSKVEMEIANLSYNNYKKKYDQLSEKLNNTTPSKFLEDMANKSQKRIDQEYGPDSYGGSN